MEYTKAEKKIKESAEQNLPLLKSIKKYLYDNPEIGGTEERASALLIKTMKEQGFTIEENFCGISFAFKATYDTKIPGPVIGICAEYDALPAIGHGCGHNMIAATSVGAAIALKDGMENGKVILFGTPAEENLVRKADMARAGAFDDVDVCMMTHPEAHNRASCATAALQPYEVDFFGRSAHAGGEPEKGINALDAAVDFYTEIREKTPSNVNVHGVIAEGGVKASIIPDVARIQYFCRADSMKEIEPVYKLFVETADKIAKKYGASYKIWEYEPANKNMVTNQVLSGVFNKTFEELGGGEVPDLGKSGGSTDMGDVSQVCPAIHTYVGLGCDVLNHSVEFAQATMTEKADEVMLKAAQALAITGLKVMTDEELLKKIKEEFDEG